MPTDLDEAALPGVLDSRVAALRRALATDLLAVESELASIGRSRALAARPAAYLLGLGGKRLRPLAALLAARAAGGDPGAARPIAVAVELVHGATLLHDDVVDEGELRRGAPAAQRVFGNAAAIFAGDWLLARALVLVERAGFPGVLLALLATIERMIEAETDQLARRGSFRATADDYWRIADGKTASLFRFALRAGAVAGGASEELAAALERYGHHLGLAFQATDDVLDYTGDAAATGKTALADLREGKLTLPLLLAVEREPALRVVLERLAAGRDDGLVAEVVGAVTVSGALDATRAVVLDHVARARDALAPLPTTEARTALETIALAVAARRS